MTDQELIQFLWRHGHFWDPARAEASSVFQADLPKLTLADKSVKEAVASFQAFDANLMPLSMAHHRRAPIADGDVGPATRQLADVPRCSMPDHAPPPGARFYYDDPRMQSAVESMQQWAEAQRRAGEASSGTGSWPARGCDPQFTTTHSIRVVIDTSDCPSVVRNYLDEALAACSAAYADIGLSVRYGLDGGEAEIVKRFEPLSGSVIGWNEFPQPNTCNQQINGRLDTNFRPEMPLWANLECHETGHGVGLEHTRGGIMNPSILLVWPLTWRGDPSYATLRRYFGGEPIQPVAPPPPPPPGPGSRLRLIAEIDDTGGVPQVVSTRVSRVFPWS